jgi:hypothetical protein
MQARHGQSAGRRPGAKSDDELAPFRAGYVFGFFNATTWQVAIGTPMVLFAERLGATPLQVGLAYSFVFLLTPIQVLSTSLLARYGYKRVMLAGWSARSVFLAVPIVLAFLAERLGPQAWMAQALVASVFFFCFFRSIGSAAIVPWLYSILPPQARGRYFGTDQFISGLSGVGILITSAVLFVTLPVHQALVAQYSLALVGSICSFFALQRLPEAPPPPRISLGGVLRASPGHMFRRSDYRRYLWLSVWFAVATTSIPPFAAYYLKVGQGLEPGSIMIFEVLRFAGVIVAAAVIRRRIDITGAKPFFVVTMGLLAAVAIYWWLLLGGRAGPLIGVHLAYFTLGLSAGCWTLANLNYLAKVTEGAERTLAIALYGAVTACCGGVAPILWGGLLKAQQADGSPTINVAAFQWFFVTVLVSVVLLSSRFARLPEDKAAPAEPLVIGTAILRPFRAMTHLVSLIDVRRLPVPKDVSADREERP